MLPRPRALRPRHLLPRALYGSLPFSAREDGGGRGECGGPRPLALSGPIRPGGGPAGAGAGRAAEGGPGPSLCGGYWRELARGSRLRGLDVWGGGGLARVTAGLGP